MNNYPYEKQLASVLRGMDAKTLYFNNNDLLIEPTLMPELNENDNHPHLQGIYLKDYLPFFIYKKVQVLKRKALDINIILNAKQEVYVIPKQNKYGQMEYTLIMSGTLFKLTNAFYQLKCANWSNEGVFEYSIKKETSFFSDKFLSTLNLDKRNKDDAMISIKDLIHPDDVAVFDRTIQKASKEDYSFCFSARLLTGKKRYKWFEFCGRTFKVEHPDDIIILSKTSDISVYKTEIENLKKDKYKAVRSNQFRTQFLKKFSHAIRTPLNSVSGFAGMILDDDFSKEEKLEFTEIIERNSEKLVGMVRDFTETMRIESKEIELYPGFFDPQVPLLNIFGQFEATREYMKKDNVQLVVDIPDNATPFMVHADKSRFIQVFSQLIDNALKFTEEGSIRFGYKMKKDKLIFFVEDTGIGIDESEKGSVFHLYNEHASDKQFEQFDNGGLGLYICKNLVDLMQGEIGFRSTINKGSTFFFTLPYKKITEKERTSFRKSNNKYESFKWAGKKVLVVDDAKEIHHFIKLTLRNTSVACLYADSGEACIDLFKSISDIDLILLDIQMPGQNGIETIKEILKQKPEMPVIALTAHALLGDKENLKKLGFTDYISKPIQRSELFKSLKKVLK